MVNVRDSQFRSAAQKLHFRRAEQFSSLSSRDSPPAIQFDDDEFARRLLRRTVLQILNYVVSIDFIFFGLTGAAAIRMKTGHTALAIFFVAACWITVLATIAKDPRTSSIGLGLMAAGVPVYWLWTRNRRAS